MFIILFIYFHVYQTANKKASNRWTKKGLILRENTGNIRNVIYKD